MAHRNRCFTVLKNGGSFHGTAAKRRPGVPLPSWKLKALHRSLACRGLVIQTTIAWDSTNKNDEKCV
jgi:hypothetical protein